MSKYPCELIEDLIPLYIEDDVSDATREIVDGHLKDCKDCSTLLKDFANDDLNLKDIKEDLPQVDTFKKWMRRLKIWGIIAVSVAIICAAAIGIVAYKIGESPKDDILTLKSIVITFEKQGMKLTEDSSKSADKYELGGVKPAVFSIDENKDTLLIYIFKSFVKRSEAAGTADRFNSQFSSPAYTLNAKNAFIVLLDSKEQPTEVELNEIAKTRDLISDIVFKSLNEGREIIYRGNSSSWEGTFTLKYYEHWWTDGSGTLQHESYSEDYPVIKYTASNIETVGPVDFEYQTTAGGGKVTGLVLDKDGTNKVGGGGTYNGAVPREDEKIIFTIHWKDKEENIILKAQK